MRFSKALLAVAAVAIASPALAAPTIFFGENQNPAGGVSGAPVTARNDFLSALTAGVSTEYFDLRPTGAPPINLSFTGGIGTIGATLTGGGNLRNSPNTGAYATSGSQFYDNEFNAFTVNFSRSIAAFGFYGTDIGDVNQQLQITLDAGLASQRVFSVPNTLRSNNGSLLFWGITDTAKTFTSVSFAQSGADRFGFDDLTVGDVSQVTIPTVPEPATWAMMIGGFGVIGGKLRSRRRKTQVSFT